MLVECEFRGVWGSRKSEGSDDGQERRGSVHNDGCLWEGGRWTRTTPWQYFFREHFLFLSLYDGSSRSFASMGAEFLETYALRPTTHSRNGRPTLLSTLGSRRVRAQIHIPNNQNTYTHCDTLSSVEHVLDSTGDHHPAGTTPV